MAPSRTNRREKPSTLFVWFSSLVPRYSLMIILFTPMPNMEERMKEKEIIIFKKPQSPSESAKASGNTIIVLIAPAIKPKMILIEFGKACRAIIPNA